MLVDWNLFALHCRTIFFALINFVIKSKEGKKERKRGTEWFLFQVFSFLDEPKIVKNSNTFRIRIEAKYAPPASFEI